MKLREMLKKRPCLTAYVMGAIAGLIICPTITFVALLCGTIYGYWLCHLDENQD